MDKLFHEKTAKKLADKKRKEELFDKSTDKPTASQKTGISVLFFFLNKLN